MNGVRKGYRSADVWCRENEGERSLADKGIVAYLVRSLNAILNGIEIDLQMLNHVPHVFNVLLFNGITKP